MCHSSLLPLAVQTSVIARRILLESRDDSSHETVLKMCDKASKLLAGAVDECAESSIYLNDSKMKMVAIS